MKLHLARSGGFANIQLQGTVDTTDLPPELAGRAERLLSPDNLARAQGEDNPHMADGFVYELMVWPEGTDGSSRSYLLSEADTSSAVMETLDDVTETITRRGG
jgi:hypothetical protein